jgi:hypothetical protein
MENAAPIAIGTGLLVVSWMCWTGRWRAWSKIAVLPSAPITLAPAVGLCMVLIGAGPLLGGGWRGACFALALLVSTVGIVLAMWDPSWYGPRWFRERDTTFDPLVPLNAAIAATVRTEPGEESEAVARARMGGGEPDERWRAHLVSDAHGRPSAMQRIGVVRGHLLLYPDAVVFAADVREDRMRGSAVVEIVPAASIVSVQRVPAGSRPDGERSGPDLPSRVMPRLRIDTTSGAHVFETTGAGRRARELEARYLAGAIPAPR